MKQPYFKIALLTGLIVVLSGICIAVYLYYEEAVDTGSVKPDFIITATQLQKEFESDEAAASSKYINKVLQVSGTIASIKQTEGSNVNITLKTESDLSSVICTFPASRITSKINEGEEITVKGQCSGFLMDVLLNNCAVAGL
jgi:RecJ-like exonuclease